MNRRTLLGGLFAAASVPALTACASGITSLDNEGTSASGGGSSKGGVTIGTANFTENQVLGYLYAAVLKAAGVKVTVRPNLGTREILIPALSTEEGEMQNALAVALPAGLQVLPYGMAEDSDAFVVTQETAKKGDVDVANLFTTDTDIVANDWVVLSDPKNLIPGQHVVPLIADRKADSTVRKALARLGNVLTTAQLTELNRQVDKDKKDRRTWRTRTRSSTGWSEGQPLGPRARTGGISPVRRPSALHTLDVMTGMDARDADLKKELDATLQARRELGEEYESALVDSFLEKVDQRIDGAVERRLRRQMAEQQMVVARGSRSSKPTDSWGDRFGFGIVSLVLAIPLSGIGGGVAGLPGLLVTWVGIVGVNAFQAVRSNPEVFRGRAGRRKSAQDSDWEG